MPIPILIFSSRGLLLFQDIGQTPPGWVERSETHHGKHRAAQAPSAQPPRHAKDEDQHLRHRLVEIERYFLADLHVRERGRKAGIALDRNAVPPGGLDDIFADRAAAAGDDAQRAAVLLLI